MGEGNVTVHLRGRGAVETDAEGAALVAGAVERAFGGKTSRGAVKKPRKARAAPKARKGKAEGRPTLGHELGRAAATAELREGQAERQVPVIETDLETLKQASDELARVNRRRKRDRKAANQRGEVGGIAGVQLRSYIERIERLEEDKKSLGADIRVVYAEAKHSGFDTKVMRRLIKDRATDPQKLQEFEALLATYQFALGI